MRLKVIHYTHTTCEFKKFWVMDLVWNQIRYLINKKCFLTVWLTVKLFWLAWRLTEWSMNLIGCLNSYQLRQFLEWKILFINKSVGGTMRMVYKNKFIFQRWAFGENYWYVILTSERSLEIFFPPFPMMDPATWERNWCNNHSIDYLYMRRTTK